MKLDGNNVQLGYRLDMEKYAKQIAIYNSIVNKEK